MTTELKQIRKDIRFYHRQLTVNHTQYTVQQLNYYMMEYRIAQLKHTEATGSRYTEYELPKPFTNIPGLVLV